MQYANATAAPREELTDVVMEGLTSDDQFVGLKLVPALPLSLPTGHVPKIKISTGNLMRATSKGRAPGSDFDRWQTGIDSLDLVLVQVGEEVSLPDEQTLIYSDYFAFESFYAKEAANRLLRGHEIDVASAIFNTGNFDATNSAVAYTVANLATMTPTLDIINAINLVKARGEQPNTIVIPWQVYNRIRTCADMRGFIAGSVNPGAYVTPSTIQSAFSDMGIKQVLISNAVVNQGQDGTDTNLNPIFAVTYMFVGSVKDGALQTGGVGRTFYWEKEGPLLNVSSYRDEPKKSNVIRAMKTTLIGVTNSRAGTLITTQYS
jgi:hypothetical protein